MSQQTLLDSYFKSTRNVTPVSLSTMDKKSKFKKRNLSLSRTPKPVKSPKTMSQQLDESKTNEVVICLSSDDEEQLTPAKRQYPDQSRSTSVSQKSTSSMNSNNSLNTPIKSDDSASTIILSPSTYQILPSTPAKSPASSQKFYSPSKKRMVSKRSPVKRKLNLGGKENNHGDSSKYIKDAKTVFLLSIINKCLNNDALKQLLDEESQVLLSNCLNVVEPGMRVVCRLFWRQLGWYREELLQQIASGTERAENTTENAKSVKTKITSSKMGEVLKSLIDNQLITPSQNGGISTLQLEDYVKLLSRPELLKVCQEFKIKVQNKQDAAEALRKFSLRRSISSYGFGPLSQKDNNKHRLMERLHSTLGPCYKLSDRMRSTLDKLYVLMYLGIDYTLIREKKLEHLLLLDKANKETYPIDKNTVLDDASIVFEDKEEFNRYFDAHMLHEQYITSADAQEACDLVLKAYNLYKELTEQKMLRYKTLSPWLRRFTPGSIYIKMMESGVQELKKARTEEQYSIAVDILNTLLGQLVFRQHKRAQWHEEKALILHKHLNRADQAANTILQAFKTDLSEEAKDCLRRRAKMIAEQRNLTLDDDVRHALRECVEREHILERNIPADHVYKVPMDNYNQKGKLKFSVHTDEGRRTVSAEEYCIIHYKDNVAFTHGEHCEGRIVTALFSLLFWDIIYSKPVGISGIFLSYYQRHPLDMYSENFYINRQTLIEDRLAFIEESTEDMLVEMIQNKLEERPESEISEMSRGYSSTSLGQVARCLGGRSLAAVCRRLARNYGYAHSGFPDLTLWNVNTRQIKFVEVKTDADKPSMKQLQWLDYLISNGIQAGFCYVGVNTTRSKARARDSLMNT